MKLHDCRPVDNLVKLQTKDDGLPLGFCTPLFVKSLLLYKTEKNWRNFCPQKMRLTINHRTSILKYLVNDSKY